MAGRSRAAAEARAEAEGDGAAGSTRSGTRGDAHAVEREEGERDPEEEGRAKHAGQG